MDFKFKEKSMSHKNMFEDKENKNREYQGKHEEDDFTQKIIKDFIDKIKNNKKLMLLVIIAGVLIIGIGIFLLISFFPVIYKMIAYINTNGVQGVFDLINQFLERLWSGK